MQSGCVSIRSQVSIVLFLATLVAGFSPLARADSIRVDDVWFQDVYIVVTSDFYHILDPADGTAKSVLKKRQNISEPRFTKDEAERAAMKARWDEAAKLREKADQRDIELRVRDSKLSNSGEDGGGKRPAAPKLTPQERAARDAAWQQVLEERRLFQEQRQQYLRERAGIVEEGETQEGETLEEATQDPTPPGARQQPGRPAEPTEIDAEAMERIQAEPYYATEQQRFYDEQQRNNAEERSAAEQLYWSEREAQGDLDSIGNTPP